MWAKYSLEGIIPPAFPPGAAAVLEQCYLGTLKSLAALWALCNAGRGNCASACPCSHLPVLCLSPGEEAAVWQCLTLLEEGLSHSPSNAQFKLLLIRIYCRLGAFEPVSELYSSLDAKHIQHDTIGWVVHTENNQSCWPHPDSCSILCHPEFSSTLSHFHVCKSVLGFLGGMSTACSPFSVGCLSWSINYSEGNWWNVWLAASQSLVFQLGNTSESQHTLVWSGVCHWAAFTPLRWRKNSKPSHGAFKKLTVHSTKSLNLPMNAGNAVKCPAVSWAAACQGSGWHLPRAVCCSYLLTRYAGSLGHYAAASQSCNFALRFFHSNQKDVSWKKPPPWPCNTAKCLWEALEKPRARLVQM